VPILLRAYGLAGPLDGAQVGPAAVAQLLRPGESVLTGGADNVLVLQRERGGAEAILSVFGRDTEDQRLALSWDGAIAAWSLLGPADADRPEAHLSEEGEEIMCLLWDAGKPLTPKEVSDALDKSHNATKQLLWKMALRDLSDLPERVVIRSWRRATRISGACCPEG
jgi:hypothetical protein